MKNSPYLGQGLHRGVGLEDEELNPLHPVGNGRRPLELLKDGFDAMGVHVVTAAGLTASEQQDILSKSVTFKKIWLGHLFVFYWHNSW